MILVFKLNLINLFFSDIYLFNFYFLLNFLFLLDTIPNFSHFDVNYLNTSFKLLFFLCAINIFLFYHFYFKVNLAVIFKDFIFLLFKFFEISVLSYFLFYLSSSFSAKKQLYIVHEIPPILVATI